MLLWYKCKRALWWQQRGDCTGTYRKRINASYQKRSRVCSKRKKTKLLGQITTLPKCVLHQAVESGLTELTRLTNMMYEEGYFPEKINYSIFTTLPIVSGTAKCEKHRTISLMSHVTKLVLRVLMNRLRAWSLMGISQVQYGLMPDRGTRNVILVLRRLV